MNKITEQALSVRDSGLVSLIFFALKKISLKIIAVLFVLRLGVDLLFYGSKMNFKELVMSVIGAAVLSFIIGLIIAVIYACYVMYFLPEEN